MTASHHYDNLVCPKCKKATVYIDINMGEVMKPVPLTQNNLIVKIAGLPLNHLCFLKKSVTVIMLCEGEKVKCSCAKLVTK